MHAIDVSVCAEGIETASQLMLCKRLESTKARVVVKSYHIKDFEVIDPMETAAISLGQTLETKS